MLKAIIFDCDGVIIDSETAWDRGQEIFLKRRNLDYHREELKPLLTGQSMVDGVKTMKKLYGFDGDDQQLAKEREEIVNELLKNSVGFIPGFLEFYNQIQNKYLTAVATSLSKGMLKDLSERLLLNKLFGEHLYSIEDVGSRSKPDPAIFLYAAEKLGVKPEECAVIEDSPYGISAAKAGGMYCFGLATTYPPERLRQADQIVNSFSEIKLF